MERRPLSRRVRAVALLAFTAFALLALPAAPATAGWNDGGKCGKHWDC